eukprot:COSAG06_NODE_583_length_14006_cov_10.629251_10_plen_622_part_00
MWDRYWDIRDNLGEYGTDLELGDSNDWDGSLRGCGRSDDLTYIYTGVVRPWLMTPDATNPGLEPVSMYPFCNEDRNNGDWNAQEVDYNGDGNIDNDECSIDLRDYIQITVNGAQIEPADIELSLSPPHFGCGGNPDCGVDGKIFIMTFTVAADVPDSATAQCQVQGNEKVTAGPLKLEGVNFARGLFGLNDFSTLPDNVGYCFPSKPFMTFIALGKASNDNELAEKLAAGTETSEGSLLLGVHGLASATLADGAGDASDTVPAPLIDPPFGQETCELLTATETIAEFAATVDGFVTKESFTEVFDAIVFENEIQNPVADVSATFAGYSTTTSSSFQGIDQEILDTLAADRDILHFRMTQRAVDYSTENGGTCDISHASFTVRDDALLFSITVSTGHPDRSRSSEGCFETLENIDGMPECGQSCGWNDQYCDGEFYANNATGSCDWDNPVCSYQCFQAPTTFGDYMTTGMPNQGPGILDAIMRGNCGERCDGMRSVAEQFDWSTVTLGPMRTTTTAKFFAKTITDSSDDANAIMASFGDAESWPALVNDIVALEVIDPPVSSTVTATPGRLAGISGVSGTALLPAPLPPASPPAPPIWETVYQWGGPPPPAPRTYRPRLSID